MYFYAFDQFIEIYIQNLSWNRHKSVFIVHLSTAKSLVVNRRWCRTGGFLSQARPDGRTRTLGSTNPCCNACFGELCWYHLLEQGAISRRCATVEQHTQQVQGTEGKATWLQPEQWTIIVHNINSDQRTLVLHEQLRTAHCKWQRHLRLSIGL